jgi:UDP-N-acetylglucosamine--N-acetylmuramyl-(pentapeptide) pyrophosphoryl-undecaprenol N-acetylglucosamine transferase
MRLVVTGGGTGGHIYPAIAVAQEMLRFLPGSRCFYLGTPNGMEKEIVKRQGIPFCEVRSSGVAGKSPIVAIKGLARASLGVTDAMGYLRDIRPDVVLGTGGYVSGPVVLAAYLMRIPSAIQEQNAVPGKTNKLLSILAKRTFAAFECSRRFFPTRSMVIVSGNPVRRELLGHDQVSSKEVFGLPKDKPVILFLGGSRGAQTLALAGIELVKKGLDDWSILFITGSQYYQEVLKSLGQLPQSGIEGRVAGNIIIKPYVHNMAAAYAVADLVVGRAGGMTIAEITALGLPSIIVPSPNVAGNHQEYNARALEEVGAALIVREEGDAVHRLVEQVNLLVRDPERLRTMRRASKSIGKPNAASHICRELIKIARET